MDPNTALAEARGAVRRLVELLDADIAPGDDVDHDAEIAEQANRVAERFQGLDSWLSGQGFLPNAWRPHIQLLVTLPDRSQIGVLGFDPGNSEAHVALRSSPGAPWGPPLPKTTDYAHEAGTYHIGEW